MITLDATLAAAQSSQDRRPLCKIVSHENVNPIPFDGELLSTSTDDEQHASASTHSTGRLFVAFAVDTGTTDTIRYGYTDTARTFFSYVDFALLTGRVAGEVSVVELADNTVGLVWEENASGTRSVKYRVLTVEGVDVVPAVSGTIFTIATASYFTGPAVARLSDDSYLLTYGKMDGADYKLYVRTSADFASWSAESAVDLSALTSTQRKANPSLIALAGGVVWLLFDYVESIGPNGEVLTNVYYAASSNKFSTNSAAAALTSYTEYGNRAEHPVAAADLTGLVYLAFDRVVSALRIDSDSTGWCSSTSPISNMHIDVPRQKLYAVSSRMGSGNKTFFCAVKIDLTTWEIDDCWTTATVPAFPDYLSNTAGVWWDDYKGAGEFVPVGHANGIISVLDGELDTITTYAFYDFSAYGIAQNVNWTAPAGLTTYRVAKVQIDYDAKRMWVALVRGYYYSQSLVIGWIDLEAAGPTYDFTIVVTRGYSGLNDQSCLMGLGSSNGFMEVNASAGLIIVGMEVTAGSYTGKLQIFDAATGGLWKEYTVASNPTFPYRGMRRGVYNAGLIVGDFTYEAAYNQADYRGLCIIDTATDIITYNRPPFASVNDYGMRNIILTAAGEYIIAANTFGIVIFNGTTWRVYDNAALPGMTPSGEEAFYGPIAYNPTTEMVIAGHGNAYNTSWTGLVMFSRDGYIKQSNYIVGTPGTPYSWTSVAALVRGYTDYEATLTFDPDDGSLYAFWTNLNSAELSIKWDKALAEFDVTDYLLRGEAVERAAVIDCETGAWDAWLDFSCSHGHLFDAANATSLLRSYLAGGRRIEMQFGEQVGATQYWEPSRVFTISHDAEVDYSRGEYPTVKVACETPRRRWSQIHIVASEYYSTTPELIIADLLETYANIDSADISLGTWPNSATVEYQFVDILLSEAIDMLALHFGYSIRDGASGVVQAVKITNAAAVAVAYADNSKLLKATPLGKNSSLVNRWVVECEERTFTELLMAEELAATFNASHRWNTGSKEYRVDYTYGNRIYRNPRLVVIDSVESLAFNLAGSCSETLVDNSHDEADFALWDTYCTIEVDSPDLTAAFVAALTQIVGSYFIPDTVIAWGGGITVRVGSYVSTLWTFIALNILAATGNFQYQVWGQPVAKVRRTVQASADDFDGQVSMGQVICEPPFKDPICGSASECQAVADFRKMVSMSERKRWAAETVADLRVEDGDTVSVLHPISSQMINVFLTDVVTRYIKPEAGSGSTGGIFNVFEGWRL